MSCTLKSLVKKIIQEAYYMTNAKQYENRHQFLMFVKSVFESDVEANEMSEFYTTGFLPISWVQNLFARKLTHEQISYVIDMMDKMYPESMSSRRIMNTPAYCLMNKPRVVISKNIDNQKSVSSEESQKEMIDHNGDPSLAIKKRKPQERHYPWKGSNYNNASTQRQKKGYTQISEIIADIFDTACKRSIDPTKSCIDVLLLKESLKKTLPDHRIDIDSISKIVSLFNENDQCVLIKKIPEY